MSPLATCQIRGSRQATSRDVNCACVIRRPGDEWDGKIGIVLKCYMNFWTEVLLPDMTVQNFAPGLVRIVS